MPKRADPANDESLKRLGGGRWQTRDERFTIEPQSGTWAVVDAEETDDFGLPLVRGPFPSLTAAKEAIAAARSSAPAESPLAGRLTATPSKKRAPDATAAERAAGRTKRDEPEAPEEPEEPEPAAARRPPNAEKKERDRGSSAEPGEPSEPSWIRDLSAADRGRARRLIGVLTAVGVPDPEGIVRRDLAGGVPAIAAVAVARAIAALGDDARPDDVAAAVAEGRDDELGVRWRLVDADGRPILVERRARKRKG
ncbi:MAG TPA: hypothetical protein VFJ71_00075 [Candidatus Limnocylindrales bacterium]|nr:hypothetical protein [Candidatus Limnocylindrales bacterium]